MIIEADRQWDIRELVTGLIRHSSIQSIELLIPRTWYPFVMPALRTLPSLATIELWVAGEEDVNAVTGPDVMACISDALPMTGLDASRELKLMCFDLSSEGTRQRLSEIISSGCLESLKIFGCLLNEHDTILCSALAKSSLQRLYVDGCGIPPMFVEGFGSMSELVDLTFNEVESKGLGLRVVDMAARMPRLTDLNISTDCSPDLLDLPLAKCARQSKSLRRISVLALCQDSKHRANSKVLLPAFGEAMKESYQIQEVSFSSGWDNPFDPSMVQNVNMFARLNCAGRDYIATDASNRRKGIEILECVNDDLNSLLVLLRENPLLCMQEKTARG